MDNVLKNIVGIPVAVNAMLKGWNKDEILFHVRVFFFERFSKNPGELRNN